MTVRRWASDELLEVLACDVEARPEAPGVEALAPFLRAAARRRGELSLEIDEAGYAVARAFVAAECVCCATIGWELVDGPPLTLQIRATEAQIEALTALVPKSTYIDSHQ